MILLDTSILSLAFRRRRGDAIEPPEVAALRRLIEDDAPIAVPGIVLQELLSGVRDERQAAWLERAVEGFPLVLATRDHHLRAARIANRCRRDGIAVSTPDCLIAATALEEEAALFTLDADFSYIAERAPLRLLKPAGGG
jgi:predicted nucleic acid-binding protein